MTNSQENLEYVKNVLQDADQRNSYPAIYMLWGSLVFIGFGIIEYRPAWVTGYWLIVAPLGMVISAWLGARHDRTLGQHRAASGKAYLHHFALTLVFIFTAIFTGQYATILLLIGLAYCLAGIHLDKYLLWLGVLSLLVYLGMVFLLITNNLVVGAIFGTGFFISAYLASKPVDD